MNDSEESDATLLRDWLENQGEASFVSLVERYSGLVHMAAMRISGDAGLAAEAAQNTFIALARKAKGLSSRDSLAGWLHLTAVMQAKNLIRHRLRETRKIQHLLHHMESQIQDHTAEEWQRIQPVLDDALSSLPAKDRDVILLRYYRSHSVRETASVLGIATEAAQKRINRAMEKLRAQLVRRGCHTSGSLGATMAMGFGLDLKSTLPSSAKIAAKAISAGGATSYLTTASIIIMTKKSAVIAGSAMLLAGIGAIVVQQSSDKSHATAASRVSNAPAASEKTAVASTESETTAASRSRRAPKNPELASKYGESRTNLSRHISEKIIGILENANELQNLAIGNQKFTATDVSKALLQSELGETYDQMNLSDEQIEKVGKLVMERQKMVFDQLKQRADQLKKDPSPLMQAILANDAFSRGEISEEEHQRLIAGTDQSGIDLTSPMGIVSADDTSLLSNPKTLGEFKGILTSEQQSQLQAHLDEAQSQQADHTAETASRSNAGLPVMNIEQLDKAIDSAQKMTTGMKSMMEGMTGMENFLPKDGAAQSGEQGK
jgi:RNA polymerase sigma factor (sigma-70 family)